MSDAKKYIAEFIGTFVLVFMGCGSAVIAGAHIGFLGISLAFGLSVLVMVYTIGNISGCHINPAITASIQKPWPSHLRGRSSAFRALAFLDSSSYRWHTCSHYLEICV
jgi:hypothetical protein